MKHCRDDNNTKTRFVSFRLTENEWIYLKRSSEKAKKTISEFIRSNCRDGSTNITWFNRMF